MTKINEAREVTQVFLERIVFEKTVSAEAYSEKWVESFRYASDMVLTQEFGVSDRRLRSNPLKAPYRRRRQILRASQEIQESSPH